MSEAMLLALALGGSCGAAAAAFSTLWCGGRAHWRGLGSGYAHVRQPVYFAFAQEPACFQRACLQRAPPHAAERAHPPAPAADHS